MSETKSIVDRVMEAKHDSLAADDLIRDYLPFIRSEAASVSQAAPGQSLDDEISIAMLAFHEAIEGYDQAKGSFLGYAARIIRNRLVDYFRREKRHYGQVSLSTPVDGEEGAISLEDVVPDDVRHEEMYDTRQATKQEIEELIAQLGRLGLSLTAIADNAPKQARTKAQVKQVLLYAKNHPVLIHEAVRTNKLPMTQLVGGTGVEKKTIERHRKYLMAMFVIFSNGYELIRGHLKQVFARTEGALA